MSLSLNYEVPRLPYGLLSAIRTGNPPTKSGIREFFIATPEELIGFNIWAESYGNLIKDYEILQDIDAVAKELSLNDNKTIEKTNFLFQQVIQDPVIKYFADQMELVNLNLKEINSVLNDETVQTLLRDEKKLPLAKKIIQNASYLHFITLKDKKDKIPEDITSIIINSLNHEQLVLCTNASSYQRDPKLFTKDLPFYLALTKTDRGQEIIVCKLNRVNDTQSTLRELIKPIISLLNHLDNKHIISFFKGAQESVTLFDLDIFSEAIPFLLSKLSADDIVELLKSKYRLSLLRLEHLAILLNEPLLTERFLPSHLQSLFSWPEKVELLRKGLFAGILNKEMLLKITGHDFDIQSLPKGTSEGLSKEIIRSSLFNWASNKSSSEKKEAIKFSLSMGCINEFHSYVATLSETERTDFFNELGSDIIFSTLCKPDADGNVIWEKDFKQMIPFIEFLLTKDDGEKYLNILMMTLDSDDLSLINTKFAELIPFFNKILEKENGFDVLKKVLFTEKVVDYINKDEHIELIMKLHLTSEQLTEVLSTNYSSGGILFDKLITYPNGELLWKNLDISSLIKLLTFPVTGRNETILHIIPDSVIPILEKILKDKKNGGFAVVKKLLLTEDSTGMKPVEMNLLLYVSFLKKLLYEKEGPEFVRSLINSKIITKLFTYLEYSSEDPSKKVFFLLLDEAGFSPKEILDILFLNPDKGLLNCGNSNTWIAALPLLEKLADNPDTKETLKSYLIPENHKNSVFWNNNLLKDAMPLWPNLNPIPIQKSMQASFFLRMKIFLMY